VIHHGDLFDVLPTLDAESIDACCTDPPYGIGFMGREWDTFKPEAGAERLRREGAAREEPSVL
jgi:DNA modification methylase